jgi:hypothetical protein
VNLKAIVRTYTTKIRPRAESELDWFRAQPDLESALRYAALATDRQGKRLAHQRRLTKGALQRAHRILTDNKRAIAKTRSFEELFSMIENLLEPVDGIGEFYVYDTALRLGAKLGLYPRKVYLHSGTRAGASALGLNTSEKALRVGALPHEFRKLQPHEIEDVLCIFKSEFSASSESARRKEPRGQSWCA